MGRVHSLTSRPSSMRVGDRVGLRHKILRLGSWMGRVGSGPVSKISNKCTIYTQETDYLTSIINNDNNTSTYKAP